MRASPPPGTAVGTVAVDLVRNPRARRYIVRVPAVDRVRVTIPRGGSVDEALRFVRRHTAWIARQLRQRRANPVRPRSWTVGAVVLFRGWLMTLAAGSESPLRTVRLGLEEIAVPNGAADLRPTLELHLWRLAARELPPRVFELARQHGLEVRRVAVRNQRSRWGSCSRRKVISLNWRLIQAPPFVADYIILHELMHLREMNHSARFWQAVADVCPDYRAAERWLSRARDLLGRD